MSVPVSAVIICSVCGGWDIGNTNGLQKQVETCMVLVQNCVVHGHKLHSIGILLYCCTLGLV